MDQYITRVAQKVGIDPAIIAAIIAALMQIITNCIPKPKAADISSGGGMTGRVAIYRALLANGIRPRSADGEAIYNALSNEPKTDEEVVSFMSQV